MTVWVLWEADSKTGIWLQGVYLGGTGDTGSGMRKGKCRTNGGHEIKGWFTKPAFILGSWRKIPKERCE